MDNATRKLIQEATQTARKLLEHEYREQLAGVYDILPDGSIAPQPGEHLAPSQRLIRQKLVGAINHKIEKGQKAGDAVAEYLREAAFTTLNRFVALKMLESRGLTQECVSRGEQSAGFREFSGLAPGLAPLPDHGYRIYLECLFDEIGREVPGLFDCRDDASLLWPRRQALSELLDTLNARELAGVWAEDETIGWVYQYFNSLEERRKMRDESAAPRNSYELAVRNQFFTPRYVVEFLADNTLGRTWYEMTQGRTRLGEQCRYLVRQPDEVSIPRRPLKDPRNIRALDPACGSGHFLLYSFDLFQTIYEEAYNDEELGPTLQSDYPDFEHFRRAVPVLILHHNLHGIDIDARCAQIAELALWMRAQRAYRDMGLKPNERPAIKQINIVCAEPMPGEQDLLEEFIAALPDHVPGQLLRDIFERMKLAGEAGSLLRIEDDIGEPIARNKEEWKRLQERGQRELFDKSVQSPLFDLGAITDENFWDIAEEGVHNALRDYARHASLNLTNGHSFQRRLFAKDALRGFDFIDLLRLKFDVVLMNPPFGDASQPAKRYIDETYGDTKGDVYKAFVECFQDRLTPGGMLGIISSRTGFFLGQSADWRERVVLRLYRPLVLLDLGMGVLDAMVETAAYVLRSLTKEEDRALTLNLVPELSRVPVDKNDCFSTKKYETLRNLKRHQANQELQRLHSAGFIKPVLGNFPRWLPQRRVMKDVQVPPSASYPPLVCLRLLGEENKAGALQEVASNATDPRYFIVSPADFRQVPNMPFAYWVSRQFRAKFEEMTLFESEDRHIRVGDHPGDGFKYLRLFWEVPAISSEHDWRTYQKGGSYSPYFYDFHLIADWDRERQTYKGFFGRIGRPVERPSNHQYFFRQGLTWPRRSQKGLNVRIHPAGSIFADKGPVIFANEDLLLPLLGLTNSQVFQAFIKLQMVFGSYEVGVMQRTPIPDLSGPNGNRLGQVALECVELKRGLLLSDETCHFFQVCGPLPTDGSPLIEKIVNWQMHIGESEKRLAELQSSINDIAFRLYDISAEDRRAVEQSVSGAKITPISDDEDTDEEDNEQLATDHYALTTNLFSYALGCVLGRWDVRYATGEKEPPPLPDPFAPLPVCAPGALQGDDGLPLTSSAQLPEGYPLTNIAWDGVLVDDPGHPKDLMAAVRAVFDVIWEEKADDIWREAAALLEAPGGDLRAWFRKSFFEEHKKRYSKSRRKAPIYWQLATLSGSYSIWLYYHRFSKDTFYSALRYVKDKLDHEESKLAGWRSAVGDAQSRSQRREIDEQESFVAELRALREEVERIAPLWNPNLNDGVIINFAPLRRLVPQHRAWQKELRDCWEKLKAGEYDWAHLAMHLWPERVVPKCQSDASLAIAHGLEEVFWQQDEKGKWQRKEVDDAAVKRLIEERASTAVKAALKSLLEAPAAQNGSTRQRATVAEPQPSAETVKAKGRKRAAKPEAEQSPVDSNMFETEA
jgi:Eco57I restriction-modification methylase